MHSSGTGRGKWGTISEYRHGYANRFSRIQMPSTGSIVSLLCVTISGMLKMIFKKDPKKSNSMCTFVKKSLSQGYLVLYFLS